jgi:AcrR family transcriptional regulator
MARWEPDAAGRLQRAAYELFREHGYDQATVEEIAARAGVTSRTFFRHFSDKREVLFAGSDELAKFVGQSISAAPRTVGPLEAILLALEAAAPFLEQPRQQVRERRALIAAHAELRERELMKLTAIATAAVKALRARGVSEPTARLIAETSITVFKVGLDRWLDDKKSRDLVTNIRLTFDDLKTEYLKKR